MIDYIGLKKRKNRIRLLALHSELKSNLLPLVEWDLKTGKYKNQDQAAGPRSIHSVNENAPPIDFI